ncbi:MULTISPECIES: hypothetical protein [unclassified Enterobacter]|uniref:hypothetical protein n=1 Tax=unclassified Enterobacter TaxID=2608935 RepID=UPI0008E1C8C0|nr:MULTISPECIES: hypothetical protein [unclassified Enterobacter]SFQ98269.1 hypothetical protein SAMN04487773_0733 [Enterobacter sp. kpr-6]
MNTIKTVAAAAVLSALSFGAFAAPVYNTVSDTSKPTASFHATDIEAGSNIQPGAQSTGRSMDDAFDAHTLVAGEWY